MAPRFAVLALVTACTTGQLRTAHRAGELAAGGALVGMLGVIVAAVALPDHAPDLLRGGVVFVPITVAGALVYAVTDAPVNRAEAPPASPAHGRAWTAAYELARQAKHAARRHDCAEVQAIEPRVRELDSDVYLRFLNDPVIRTCRAPGP